MSVVFFVYFLGNTVVNSLMSTGAFEVLLNDQILFSKLATGQMPTSADLSKGLARCMSQL